jgi:hypothetical protein
MSGQGCTILTIMLLLFSTLGCSQRDTTRQKKGTTMHDDTIQQVQEQHTPDWMAIPGVVGTAILSSFSTPVKSALSIRFPGTVYNGTKLGELWLKMRFLYERNH